MICTLLRLSLSFYLGAIFSILNYLVEEVKDCIRPAKFVRRRFCQLSLTSKGLIECTLLFQSSGTGVHDTVVNQLLSKVMQFFTHTFLFKITWFILSFNSYLHISYEYDINFKCVLYVFSYFFTSKGIICLLFVCIICITKIPHLFLGWP